MARGLSPLSAPSSSVSLDSGNDFWPCTVGKSARYDGSAGGMKDTTSSAVVVVCGLIMSLPSDQGLVWNRVGSTEALRGDTQRKGHK